jgi:hypothetical protein
LDIFASQIVYKSAVDKNYNKVIVNQKIKKEKVMKMTTKQLQILIREQVQKVLSEGANDGPKTFFGKDKNIFDSKKKHIKEEEKDQRYAYGTRDNKWHLVGPEDRDYNTAISKEEFQRLGSKKAKEKYLSPTKIKESNLPRNIKELRGSLAAKKYVDVLERIDDQVWDYNKWGDGGEVRKNWEKYKQDLQTALRAKGIVRTSTLMNSKEITDGLEDKNFHALLKGLTELGYLNTYKLSSLQEEKSGHKNQQKFKITMEIILNEDDLWKEVDLEQFIKACIENNKSNANIFAEKITGKEIK